MRVLHVCQPVTGGVAQCVADLFADHVAAGWDVALACPPPPPDSPLSGLPRQDWVATRNPGPSSWAETRALSRLLRRVDPDLVHLHSAKAGLAGRLAVRGQRTTVYQPHAWSFEAASGPERRAAVAWERFALRWTDRVVTVSEAEQERGRQEGIAHPSKVVVVPNGVRVPPELDRASARGLVGLDLVPIVVCAGRLARQKGQDVLLAAWPAVQAEVPDAVLVLVGDGPEEARLRQDAPPGVRFSGPAADLHPWLSAADVVVVPSRWEAMSLVLLEGMAAARSVVASDVGAAQSCLLPGAGAVVPAEQPGPLALALIARLQAPAMSAEEGRTGRDRVAHRYDVTRTVPFMRTVYADARFAHTA